MERSVCASSPGPASASSSAGHPTAKQAAPCLDLAAAATLAGLGVVWSENWEGLAIGPRLADCSHLVLAGTENDYSVTQDACSVQRDVYFKPLPAGGVSRIRCDIDTFTKCLSS